MSKVTGYHTLQDRGNFEEIENNGPIKCIGRTAWCGHGYYFWEDEIIWAHRWGEQLYAEYMIFEAQIVVNNKTFDLHYNNDDISAFVDWAEDMKEMGAFQNGEVKISEVFEYVRRTTDFDKNYDAIRVSDMPEQKKMYTFVNGRLEKMYLGAYRIQICLVNKNNLVSGSFKVIYPLDYVN